MGWRNRSIWLPSSIALLAVLPRLQTAMAGLQTADERLWMDRSVLFSDAVRSRDLARASATSLFPHGDTTTMPGVTTMWIGTFARGLWAAGQAAGLWASRGADFGDAESGWDSFQASMAVATSALVGVLVFLLVKWVGWRAAAVAGVLVATEPFLVAQGAVLHTDELLASFGVAALVATALALGLPEPTPWAFQRRSALVAGGLWGGALLTKVSALMFLPGLGLLGLWAIWAALKRREDTIGFWEATRPVRHMTAWWFVSGIGVALALYPALWFRLGGELYEIRKSLTLATEKQWQFFLGEATSNPGPAFYLVALPLRVTPWLLLGGVAAAVTLCWRPATRRFAAVLACMGGPPFVVLSLAPKQFARYGLLFLMVGAIAIGIAADPLIDLARQRLRGQRVGTLAAGAAGFLLLLHAVWVAPWGVGYFNPVLGGPAVAEQAIMISWGEGSNEADQIIEKHAGSCDGFTVFAFITAPSVSCGRLFREGETPSYVVLHISERQRLPDADYSAAIGERELLGQVKHRGIVYVEVYGPLPDE